MLSVVSIPGATIACFWWMMSILRRDEGCKSDWGTSRYMVDDIVEKEVNSGSLVNVFTNSFAIEYALTELGGLYDRDFSKALEG